MENKPEFFDAEDSEIIEAIERAAGELLLFQSTETDDEEQKNVAKE